MVNIHQVDCTGPEQELVPGRLRGYRWFNYNPKSPLKIGSTRYSVNSCWPIPWQAEMTARCYPNDHGTRWYPKRSCRAPNPDGDHFCGIWGYYRPDLMKTNIQGLNKHPALGVIETWGRTLLGPRGFRSERARILAISYPGRIGLVVRKHCLAVGISVYHNDPMQMLADFQPDDVSELIGFVPEPTEAEIELTELRIRFIEAMNKQKQESLEELIEYYESRGQLEQAQELKDSLDVLAGFITRR